MGNSVSVQQSDISDSLREQYRIDSQTHLLHRATGQLCTLRKIKTTSQTETEHIQNIITQYTHNPCHSISRLKNTFHADKKEYCNQQQTFFLIFEGANEYSLREEFVKRRFYHDRFHQQEIQQIIETYICGLKQYSLSFSRQYTRLSLDCISINPQSRRMFLKDPWLIEHTDQDHMDTMTQLLLSYPSPEKLNSAYTYKTEDYNEFLSNLFSVGVIALQISSMDFVDKIYSRKKQVDFQEIDKRLKTFLNQNLKKGVQILLDPNPNERKKIYQLWGVEKTEDHYLNTLHSPQAQNKFRPIHLYSPNKTRENPHMASIGSIQLKDIQKSKLPPVSYHRINSSNMQHNISSPFKSGFSSPPSQTKRTTKMNMNTAPLHSPQLRVSFSNQKQPNRAYPYTRVPPLIIQNTPNYNHIQKQSSSINKIIAVNNQSFPYTWHQPSIATQRLHPPLWRGNTINNPIMHSQAPLNWIAAPMRLSPQSRQAPYSNPLRQNPKQIKWIKPQQQNQYH